MRLDQRANDVAVAGLSRRERGRLISQFSGPHPLNPYYFDDWPTGIRQVIYFYR
jgi:hypothetical protein